MALFHLLIINIVVYLASHLDHLHALIVERKPTGYGTEPANLVPCCPECNQPKGNMEWEDFMNGPTCHHVGDDISNNVEEAKLRRIKRIKDFEKEMPAHKVTFDKKTLEEWEIMLNGFDEKLNEAQNILENMNKRFFGKKE